MKNSQKGFAALILIIILAIVAVGGGVYYKHQKDKQSKPIEIGAQATTTDQVSGWKTYTNTKYGFSFQYPTDWRLLTDDSNSTIVIASGDAIGADVTVVVADRGVPQKNETKVDDTSDTKNFGSSGVLVFKGGSEGYNWKRYYVPSKKLNFYFNYSADHQKEAQVIEGDILKTLTFTKSSKTQPNSISIITPKAGSILSPGHNFRIAWNPTSTKVNVLLEVFDKDGNKIGEPQYLAQGIDNSGSYDWVPSATLSLNSKYKIKITKANSLNFNSSDEGESEFFTLSSNIY